MKGINAKGHTQRSFVTDLDQYERVATKTQKEGIAISDVIRNGFTAYLAGELEIKEVWTGKEKHARRQARKNEETNAKSAGAGGKTATSRSQSTGRRDRRSGHNDQNVASDAQQEAKQD